MTPSVLPLECVFKRCVSQRQRQFFQISISSWDWIPADCGIHLLNCMCTPPRHETFGSRSSLKTRGVRLSSRASPWPSQRWFCGQPLSAPGRMKVASYRPCRRPTRTWKWRPGDGEEKWFVGWTMVILGMNHETWRLLAFGLNLLFSLRICDHIQKSAIVQCSLWRSWHIGPGCLSKKKSSF